MPDAAALPQQPARPRRGRSLAATLIARAKSIYDRPNSPLPGLARAEASDGFAGGARWMAAALGEMRGRSLPPVDAPFHTLGLLKYAAATSAAVLVAWLAWVAHLTIAAPLLAVVAFYVVEVQMAFLFPAAIDGSARPFRDARRLLRAAGGTAAAVPVVMRLAAHMLFAGWFRGRGGPTRAWCVGCLAVCVWYEDVRGSVRLESRSRGRTSRPRRLELFNAGPLVTRVEDVDITSAATACPDGARRTTTLLYASDLHLGRAWTRGVAGGLLAAAELSRPDAILLGGDLVDAARGLSLLARLVESLRAVAPVFAVLGNHDARVGADRVRRAVTDAGGAWLEESPAPEAVGGILLCGPSARTFPDDSAAPRVLCAHDPACFGDEGTAAFDVVLAGHLHGGQCVLGERGGKLYPGAWINRWTGLRFERIGGTRRTTMLVSRGAADTLPVRWNCPREVLLCRIRH